LGLRIARNREQQTDRKYHLYRSHGVPRKRA
jgi:hypothetical protein